MAEKVTVMVLKVDLQCPCCYKKVKKILCKFPQIRDQLYDEKANKVTITVVCCNPEKLRDKLCCKGAKVIKSIEIVGPPKKPPTPARPSEKPPVRVPTPARPQEKPPVQVPTPARPPEKPPVRVPTSVLPPEKPPVQVPIGFPPRTCSRECYEGYGGGPCYHGFGVPSVRVPTPALPPEKLPVRVPIGFPPRTCCRECYEGYGGGPCYHGFGVPPQPPPCYDGYYGSGYGHVRPCHVTRCDYYFSEENPQACRTGSSIPDGIPSSIPFKEIVPRVC